MALALIDFVDFRNNHALFNIDTGTNNFYKLKIGKSKTEISGVKWIDDIIHATGLKRLNSATNYLNSSKNISLPANYFNEKENLVQLFTFKSETGKSPAFSRIISVPENYVGSDSPDFISMSMSKNDVMLTEQLNQCRFIENPGQPFSYQAGIEEWLGKIIKLVTSSHGSTSNQQLPLGLLNTIMNNLLNGFSSVPLNNAASAFSISDESNVENRFGEKRQQEYSKPFIAFAALIPLIAPLVQALPELMKASNEGKLNARKETNANSRAVFDSVNQRLMLLQLLQHMPQTGGNLPDINQLLQMVQASPEAQAATAATPPAPPAPPTPPAPPAVGLSVGQQYTYYSSALSTGSVLSFEFGNKTNWNGVMTNLFIIGADITLSIKLLVQTAAPKTPLPKAIVKISFKEQGSGKTLFEKTIKQKNVLPNILMDFVLTKEELAIVPVNTKIDIYGEMRWRTSSGKEIKALGTAEMVLSSEYFISDYGKATGDEVELKDINVFKAFWNKVWEAPVLDAVNQKNPDNKKFRWSLDTTGKYTYTLTPHHDSNGISETKFILSEKDTESVIEKTQGRFKSGMELSISELGKLHSLWANQSLLPNEKLIAFRNGAFAKANAKEFISTFKMDGSSNERGMIWVIPVLRLFEFKLCSVKSNHTNGQVAEFVEEDVTFPLPVAARIIGLKTE